MNPAPRPAPAASRSYDTAPSAKADALSSSRKEDLRKDDRRTEKSQELEPDWEALKDTATD